MATSQPRSGEQQKQQELQEGPGPSEENMERIQEAMQDGWVNEGYNRWLAQRQQWTSGNRPVHPRPRNMPLVTHEMVVGDRPFPRAVPLEAVIECLVDLWEEEDSWD